jgi:hypothetical protein
MRPHGGQSPHFLGDSLGMQAQQYRQLPAYLNALAKNNTGVITRLLIKRSCQDVPEVPLVGARR